MTSGPFPTKPINEGSEDQAAVEAHLLKELLELGGERKPKMPRTCPRKVPPTEQVWEDQVAVIPSLMEEQAVRTETLIDLGADDDATAAMVPVTKNTHDLGPVPHPPIN